MLELKNKLKNINLLNQANNFLKARIQEKKAKDELDYYRHRAKAAGINQPDDKQLRCLLQDRLRKRGIFPEAKPKGQLHIFLAYRANNWEHALPPALRSFGEVTEFEWGSLGFEDRAQNWLTKQQEQMNLAMLSAFKQADKKRNVDVFIGYLSGYYINPAILRKIAEHSTVIFNFCWDDKLSFRGQKYNGTWRGPAALASVVDLNLTNAPDSCIKYMVEGGLAMFWPEAADPEFHKPYDLPFKYDVSFVGAKYGWRPNFIRRLKSLGIKVHCSGFGWPNGNLSNEDMVKIYSLSRINLGFAGVGHSKKLMCLKARDFEIPMSGGLYLTQNNHELELVYDVGNEIVTYNNEKDCAERIRWLLANPDKAQQIRTAGRKRVLAEHTWINRFEQIFRIADLIKW